jgi:hypothetical protein
MNVLNFLDSLSYAERTWFYGIFYVGILLGLVVSLIIAWYISRQIDKKYPTKKYVFEANPKSRQDAEIALLEIKNGFLDIDIDSL